MLLLTKELVIKAISYARLIINDFGLARPENIIKTTDFCQQARKRQAPTSSRASERYSQRWRERDTSDSKAFLTPVVHSYL